MVTDKHLMTCLKGNSKFPFFQDPPCSHRLCLGEHSGSTRNKTHCLLYRQSLSVLLYAPPNSIVFITHRVIFPRLPKNRRKQDEFNYLYSDTYPDTYSDTLFNIQTHILLLVNLNFCRGQIMLYFSC